MVVKTASAAIATGGISAGLILALNQYGGGEWIRKYFFSERKSEPSVSTTTTTNQQQSSKTIVERHLALRDMEHQAHLQQAKTALAEAKAVWDASVDAAIDLRMDGRLARQAELAGRLAEVEDRLKADMEATDKARERFDRLVRFHSALTSIAPCRDRRESIQQMIIACRESSEYRLRQFHQDGIQGIWPFIVCRILASLAVDDNSTKDNHQSNLSFLAHLNQTTGWSRVLLKPAIRRLRALAEAEYRERLLDAKILLAKHQWLNE